MEEDLIEELKHMKLTKEEETKIVVSGEGRRELIEECKLSLVGRLLLDRKQNQRALKSMLRSAWKTRSDLRIVDVGNDTYQFKFSSEYQMRWVETNGPWNFENNLLLLKSIGIFMATDSKLGSSNQAKFMRIRVNIPLDKPLRQCGVMASPEGEKFQVYFSYERLPVFCFLCGVMGHDDRRCTCLERQTEELPQYDDWLRA
ncbi:uncharacterized protein LOC126695976 [Quercus robur]|uniref:uncharacterized protein LOC126695976 n=1 Tax=Quercus robur TaxID=38942 RepID=UPI0021619F7A|nr:uncharacterized protein LOC126695976 [Quercus robur]